jgi:hypothetical protein
MGRLKMGAKENWAFNFLNACSYSSPQTYSWLIYINLVKGLKMLLNPWTIFLE